MDKETKGAYLPFRELLVSEKVSRGDVLYSYGEDIRADVKEVLENHLAEINKEYKEAYLKQSEEQNENRQKINIRGAR